MINCFIKFLCNHPTAKKCENYMSMAINLTIYIFNMSEKWTKNIYIHSIL